MSIPFAQSPLARVGLMIKLDNQTNHDLVTDVRVDPPGIIVVVVREQKDGIILPGPTVPNVTH